MMYMESQPAVGPTHAMGEYLRAARQRAGLSTQAAAEAAKVSPAYLNKLESGAVGNPSPRVLHRLASTLDVPYWTLMRLAGYVVPERDDAGEVVPTPSPPARHATNAELAELLGQVLARLTAIEQHLSGDQPSTPR